MNEHARKNGIKSASGIRQMHPRSAGVTRGAIFMSVVVLIVTGLCVVVPAGEPATPEPDDIPIGDEPIRIRVETSQGVFLVFDAANSPFKPRRDAGFAAYWSDTVENELYLYERLLFDFVDVGHALANLERDLGVDIAVIHESDEWLADAFQVAWDQREDSTGWIRPGQTGIARLMGYNPTSDGSDGGGTRDGSGDEDRPCLVRLPMTDGEPPVVTYPPPPPEGSDVDGLIEYLVEENDLPCQVGTCNRNSSATCNRSGG